LQLPPKGLLLKVDSVVTPSHYCNKSVNPFAPKCPIKSITHKFFKTRSQCKLILFNYWFIIFEPRQEFFFQLYVVAQQSRNRCLTIGATACGQSLPPSRNSRCHLLTIDINSPIKKKRQVGLWSTERLLGYWQDGKFFRGTSRTPNQINWFLFSFAFKNTLGEKRFHILGEEDTIILLTTYMYSIF
jgi:hypothetical protein